MNYKKKKKGNKGSRNDNLALINLVKGKYLEGHFLCQ